MARFLANLNNKIENGTIVMSSRIPKYSTTYNFLKRCNDKTIYNLSLWSMQTMPTQLSQK